MSTSLDRRLARRMSYRSRSLSASLMAVVLALVCLAVVVLAGSAAWRGFAGDSAPAVLDRIPSATALVGMADGSGVQWVVIAVIAGLGIIGLAALLAAVTPGTRDRRSLQDARSVVLVDDDVIGRSLAADTAEQAGVSRSAVRAYTSRRRAVVEVTPASGFRPDADALQKAAESALDDLAPSPRLRARVRVAERGEVGGS